jgi:hypothetical protein
MSKNYVFEMSHMSGFNKEGSRGNRQNTNPFSFPSSYLYDKKKKRVSFFPYTKVYTIPNRDQLNEMRLIPVIWWNNQDYATFRAQSNYEIGLAHRAYPRLPLTAIRRVLYQPYVMPVPSQNSSSQTSSSQTSFTS